MGSLEKLRERVGDWTLIKEFTPVQLEHMKLITEHDDCKELGDLKKLIEFARKNKDEVYLTCMYLYCNWRVWMVYLRDEELARRYQSLCDMIDGFIFDEFDKKKVSYFVRETD